MENRLFSKSEIKEHLKNYITLDLNNEVFFINDFLEILEKFDFVFDQKYLIIKNGIFNLYETKLITYEDMNFENIEKIFYFLKELDGKNIKIIFDNCSFYFFNFNYFENFHFNFQNYIFINNNDFYFINLSKKLEEENIIISEIQRVNNKNKNVFNIKNFKENSLLFYYSVINNVETDDIYFFIPKIISFDIDYYFFNCIENIQKFIDNSRINFSRIVNSDEDTKIFKSKIKNDNIKNLKQNKVQGGNEIMINMVNEAEKFGEKEKFEKIIDFLITDDGSAYIF